MVNFSNNHLKKFELRVLIPSFYTLEKVNLNDNLITNLGESMRSMFPNAQLLSVVRNDLNCGYLQRFLDENKLSSLRLSDQVDSIRIIPINF